MTARLLRDAGIRPGMHVLDVGSGAGDVSLIAAELVGPSGSVIGVDRDGPSVELAGRRARAAGLTEKFSGPWSGPAPTTPVNGITCIPATEAKNMQRAS